MSWQLLFCFVKSYANQHASVESNNYLNFQTLKKMGESKPKVNELQLYFLIRKIANIEVTQGEWATTLFVFV